MNWYYVRGGNRNGPIDDDALRRLIAVGELKPNDLVWNDTMGSKWVEAFTVPGLFNRPEFQAPSAAPASLYQEPVAAAPAGAGVTGQTPNRELMARARASLQGQWGTGVVATVILYALLSFLCCGVLIISGPLCLGMTALFLSIVRGRGEVGQLFSGFQQFGRAIGAYLLMFFFIFLWSLLFVIPGIVMTYAYAMTFFVMADDSEVGPLEAIRRSKTMMRGHKWKLFCLNFRFLGWALLASLTCGIGNLWLLPYMQAATAHFYEDVRPRTTGAG